MTHHIRANNESGYSALRDFIVDHLLEEGEDVYSLAKRKISNSADPAAMTMNDAIEEVIADACEEMLANTKYAEMMAKENPTLAESIRSWVHDFAEKIRAAVSPDARRHKEAEVMRKYADELQEMWDRALVGASANAELRMQNAESESGKYSTRDFSEQVDDIRDGKFGENNQAYMGTTPPRLSNILRLPKLPMLVTKRHVISMALTEDEAKNDPNVSYDPRTHYHGLGWEAVKELPTDINKPLLIIKSNTDSTSADFVVVTNKTDGKWPVICAVKPNGKGNYFDIEFNENAFLSGYGKNNILNYVNSAKREGRILYAYKNSQQNNNTPGVQFPDNIMSADYSDNLSQFRNIVNEKFMGTTFENGKGLLPDTEYAKYSNRDITRDDTAEERAGREKSYAQLRSELERLRRRVDYWKGQSRITREASISEKDVGKLARSLIKEFESGASVESVRQKLTDLGNYLVRGTMQNAEGRMQNEGTTATTSSASAEAPSPSLGKAESEEGTQSAEAEREGTWGKSPKAEVEVNFEDVWEVCREIAADILSDIDTVIDDTNHDQRAQLVSYLKDHPLDVSGLISSGEVDREWFRAHKEIRTRNGGSSVDAVYQELQGMFGEGTFPDVSDGDAAAGLRPDQNFKRPPVQKEKGAELLFYS